MKLCKDCVNLIEESEQVLSCDYNCFENKSEDEVMFYVAEIFDCIHFEHIDSLD